LWRRTRLAAFGLAVAFHLANAYLWNIGVFPWLMIAATTLFLSPSWAAPMLAAATGVSHTPAPARAAAAPLSGKQRALAGAMLVYVVLQLLVPLRHYYFPGFVNWTDEGWRFAWHMMARDKRCSVTYLVHDARRGITVRITPEAYLTRFQVQRMTRCTDMIAQLARHIAEDYRSRGSGPVEVRVDALASLNGRPPRRLFDLAANFADQQSLQAGGYILPFD
jgi:hypothetical protein